MKDLWSFLNLHRTEWVLLPILGMSLVTGLHEAAHALAVVLQGGQVDKFVWYPTEHGFGYVDYSFSSGYSQVWVSMAPYVMWLSLAALTTIILYVFNFKLPWAKHLFVWGYFVPVSDTLMPMILASIYRSENDFMQAYPAPDPFHLAMHGFVICLLLFGGFFVQRRAYREQALSTKGYAFLTTIFLAVVIAVA